MTSRRSLAVTWDFGQTLADLDPVFLAKKLAEQSVFASPVALDAAGLSPRAKTNVATSDATNATAKPARACLK